MTRVGAAIMKQPALIAALCAFAIALPTLRNGFAIDDAYLVVGNARIRSFASVPELFSRPWGSEGGGASYARINAAYYRPLTELLYTVEYRLFGLHPGGWHATSALLHALVTALVALLAARITHRASAAWIAGLLFAVHPVHCEAIAAVTYQTTLLATLMSGLALREFSRFIDGENRGARLLWLAIVSAFAVLAKEDAATLPVLALVWGALERPCSWRQRALPWLAISVGVALVLGVRSHVVTPCAVTFFPGTGRSAVGYTMLTVPSLYLELLLVPLRLCPFYDWFLVPIVDHLSTSALLGVFIIGFGVFLVAALAPRHPAGAIGLAWLGLGLLPVMHLVPILNVAAERFLYLPSIGWAIAIGTLPVRRSLQIAIGILLLLYSARTLDRWPDWHDDRALNQATAAAFPETPTPWLNLADLEEKEGHRTAAIAALMEAARRAPGWPVVEKRLVRLQSNTIP